MNRRPLTTCTPRTPLLFRCLWTARKSAGYFLCLAFLLPLKGWALERVRLAYPARSLSALHLQVAQERGLYRKNGLEVEAIQMRPTITVAALISGEVHYLSSVGSAIRSAAQGAPIKVVSVSLTAPFFSLVVRSRYQGIQGLRGREIGLTGNPGGTNDQVLRLVLRQSGLNPQRDVQLFYVGDAPVLYSAFRGGRFDAIFISLPFPVIAEQEGFRILANTADAIRLPFIGLAVTSERLRSSRDQIKKMIRVDVEARRLIRRDKEATVEIMMRWLGLERRVALRSYDLVLPAISQEAMIDREGIRRILELEAERGEAMKITDPDQITDGEIVEEVRRELPAGPE